MRLACDDFGWPGLRPEFVLDLIREMELEGVTMGFFGGATPRDPQLIATDPEGWGERIAEELGWRPRTSSSCRPGTLSAPP